MKILRHLFTGVIIACLIGGLSNCTASKTPDAALPPQTSSAQTSSSPAAPGAAKININSAILSQLDKLEAKLGVPALSHRIQSSRPYGSTDDLVSKGVITQQQYDQIKDQVTVEDVVLTGEAKDVDYLMKLGLMQGHMLVAGELLKLNQPEQAEPHLGHPVEEIYVDLEEQFQERGVAEFKDPLVAVQTLVKTKPNDPKVQSEFQAAVAAIDQASASVPASQRQSPEFMMQVINGMLDTASAEYTAAISDGKISAAIEYQDSRGFVLYAHDTLFKGLQGQSNSKAIEPIEAKFQQLKPAWPAALPPQKPVIDSDQVAKLVQEIQKQSQSLKAT